MQPPSNKVHQILEWYLSIGVDTFLSPTPINRTEAPKLTLSPRAPSAPLAGSLAELRALYESFDGCGLKQTATTTVFGDGNPESSLMLIGETPGSDEDRQGIPFVGDGGKLLDKMLLAIGLDRTKVYITNLIPWRPPGNRAPTASEIESCLPLLIQHIELIKPKIIVFLGGMAAKALLNKNESITKLRGQWMTWTHPTTGQPIDTLSIFHPNFLLNSPGQKKRAWHDLLLLKARLQEMDLPHG